MKVEKVNAPIEDFLANVKRQYAVLRELEMFGEAAKNINGETN
ncbi:MAG: hypothetical protein QXD66_02220 [Candidatus Nezhaarchaeales archaeon]